VLLQICRTLDKAIRAARTDLAKLEREYGAAAAMTAAIALAMCASAALILAFGERGLSGKPVV
jgi:hypothetical protein